MASPRGVAEVVESLKDFLKEGQAERVIGLAGYAIDEIQESMEQVDDSDGELYDVFERLQELHLEACREAKPDPVDLAERLFEREMESSFDAFYGAVERYAEVLGEAGLEAYRRLAEAEWAKVTASSSGTNGRNRYGAHSRLSSIMEALAGDDLEARVAVKSRDLSSADRFLQIAVLYRGSG